MEEIDNSKRRVIIICMTIIFIIVLLFGGYYAYLIFFKKDTEELDKSDIAQVSNYDIRIIKEINKNETKNYLISPYSIEMTLAMLRDGTSGKTREQIDNLIGNRKINILKSEGKINVANGLFINEKYKNSILKSYYNTIQKDYDSDIIYDKLENPKVVNDWVNDETYKMIPKLFDTLSGDPLLVLVNALAIDVEWEYAFDCKDTIESKFTRDDASEINVSMMHKSYEEKAKYFKTEDAKGVIIPYQPYDKHGNKAKKGVKGLEFIGILPNTDIKNYINNLTIDEINEFDEKSHNTSDSEKLILNLPSFSYDYEINNFILNLKNLGIENIFDVRGNFSKMTNEEVFISDAKHKTFIEVDENGTKAAAATGMVVSKNAIESSVESITFDKPFAYIIRDQKTKELLFFGVVYEPNKWKGSTCK